MSNKNLKIGSDNISLYYKVDNNDFSSGKINLILNSIIKLSKKHNKKIKNIGRFNLNVEDQIGKIVCDVVKNTDQSISMGLPCNNLTRLLYTENYEVYFLNPNYIKINVPDRIDILKFDYKTDYIQFIELNTKNSANIFCSTVNDKLDIYEATIEKTDIYNQFKFTMRQKVRSILPVKVTIYCYDNIENSKVFGINYFSVTPFVQIGFYSDYFLYEPKINENFEILPQIFSPNGNLPTPKITLHNYDPYFVFNLAFPYVFNSFDYTLKTFKRYQVYNWVN
jgi:hypothetical protein